jgi:hypothetical protein
MKDLRRAVFAVPQGYGASNGSAIQRGTTAVASISTRAAFSTRRTTWTNAIAG